MHAKYTSSGSSSQPAATPGTCDTYMLPNSPPSQWVSSTFHSSTLDPPLSCSPPSRRCSLASLLQPLYSSPGSSSRSRPRSLILWRTTQHVLNADDHAAIEALNAPLLRPASLHLPSRCVTWLPSAVRDPPLLVRSRLRTSQSKSQWRIAAMHRTALTGSFPRSPRRLHALNSGFAMLFCALATTSFCSLTATRRPFCFFANYHRNHLSPSTYRLCVALGLPCVRHCPTHGNHLRHRTPFAHGSRVHTLRYVPA